MAKLTNQDRIYIARNILHYRKSKGWTQEQLAFESNSTDKYISDLQLAKRNATIDTVSKVAKALGQDLSTISKPVELFYWI